MDRFILGKYLAKTAGYSLSMINQYSADINTDGEINDIDYTILARHLADWIGYENLSIFAQESNSEVYSPIWQMKYSSNTINIIVSLESGNLYTSKDYIIVV